MTSTVQNQPVFETAEVELATFYVADLLLGIPIHEVEEISRHCAVTPVPGAPEAVCGVMSLRGEVVTVLDLARRARAGQDRVAPDRPAT